MAAPIKRSCRRPCMGCDPCWICRFSYPAYITIAANPGLPTDPGITPTEWVGCHGNAAGTYAPAVPYGYVRLLAGSGPGTIQEFDNGVTNHRTFRSPGWGSSGLYYSGSPGSYTNNPVDNCSAAWRMLTTDFVDYAGMTGPTDSTRYAVARCVDSWPPQPRTEGSAGGSVEEVSFVSVQLVVGNITDLTQVTTRAAATDSTLVRVLVRELYLGWWQGEVFLGAYPYGAYVVDRIERFQLRLDKPCPRSGTLTLPFFGRTLNGAYFGNASPDPEDFQTLPGGMGGAPPATISNEPGYDVTITL